MSLLSTLQSLKSSGRLASAQCVDLSFEVRGEHLPIDYRFALESELVRLLPWLADEPLAGIHPVRAPLTHAGYVLSRRARLQLRVDESRVGAAKIIIGQCLGVGNAGLTIGAATPKPVLPFPTLRASMVVNAFADEQAFMDDVGMQLEVLGVKAEPMCGKPFTLAQGERKWSGFSLVLHGLSIDHSLRLQTIGLGPARLLGCGLFVHHKIIEGLDAFPE